MSTLSEQIANISIPYVIAIAIVLLIARLLLGRQKSELTKSLGEITESILIAVVLVFLIIRPFIVQAFFIPSESMVPTLEISDRILVNKFVYRFQSPQRSDIVVFKSPPSAHAEEKDFIKRLMALPGDTVQIKVTGKEFDPTLGIWIPYGDLIRNGKLLNEPYISETHHIRCLPNAEIDLLKPYKIPDGKLLMMGDNRNNSNDSRFWGVLDQNRVIGKAMVRFWPMNRLGILH